MRLIDADELMEHVWRDKLDSRAEIAKMVNNAPTVKDIPANVPIDMFDQLMLERKAGEKDSEQKPIDMDMTKALILGLLLGIDKNPDEKDKLREDLVKVFAPKQSVDVLDKIRAEIESKYKSIPDTFHHYETGFTDALEWVLSIIDKYKAESEKDENDKDN